MKSITEGGVCPSEITFDIADGKVKNVRFDDGCEGNQTAIARFAEGMRVERVIKILKGIDCGGRGTSCGDQLAAALEKTLINHGKESNTP